MTDAAAIDRAALERDVLPAFLARQRWFGGKGDPGLTTRLARATPLPEGDLTLGTVAVATAGGGATYVVPFVAEGAAIADGFETPAFVRWAIDAMARDARVADGGGELRFEHFPGFDLACDAAPRWLRAEQSNSSAVVGERAVLKLLRKLAPGIHPELEMARHLTVAGFANVPPILGTATRVEADEPSLVMLLQRFVRNEGDGWSWTLAAIGDGRPYAPFARTLGERLAAMHATLARPSDDPAFAPEPLDAAGAAALGERVLAEVARAGGSDSRLAARVRAIAASAAGRLLTRIHGDLHLGQLLVTDGDVMLIDFEGEPTRPLAERRAKDLPLRDVAGVIRSFDYAEAKAGQPGSGFREAAERAFLAGYHDDGDPAADPLLLLFLLEKAAYEVSYEAANRPDWIEVPRRGLARIAGQLMATA